MEPEPLRRSSQSESRLVCAWEKGIACCLPEFASNTVVSVLVHPLTAEQRRDHEFRNAWMGAPWPLYLDSLPRGGDVPLQYPELGLGWSTSPEQEISLEERRRRGAEVEALLANDEEAAPAPKD